MKSSARHCKPHSPSRPLGGFGTPHPQAPPPIDRLQIHVLASFVTRKNTKYAGTRSQKGRTAPGLQDRTKVRSFSTPTARIVVSNSSKGVQQTLLAAGAVWNSPGTTAGQDRNTLSIKNIRSIALFASWVVGWVARDIYTSFGCEECAQQNLSHLLGKLMSDHHQSLQNLREARAYRAEGRGQAGAKFCL